MAIDSSEERIRKWLKEAEGLSDAEVFAADINYQGERGVWVADVVVGSRTHRQVELAYDVVARGILTDTPGYTPLWKSAPERVEVDKAVAQTLSEALYGRKGMTGHPLCEAFMKAFPERKDQEAFEMTPLEIAWRRKWLERECRRRLDNAPGEAPREKPMPLRGLDEIRNDTTAFGSLDEVVMKTFEADAETLFGIWPPDSETPPEGEAACDCGASKTREPHAKWCSTNA